MNEFKPNSDKSLLNGADAGAKLECSSTIILVRMADQSKSGTLETLMVQRATSMGFAADALVFPGGKVDPADRLAVWTEHPAFVDTSNEQRPLQVAAIRELFEETGVLLARRDGVMIDADALEAISSDMMALRHRVNNDAKLFAPLLSDHNLEPAFDLLTLFARWQTPRMAPRRFDTWFYVAPLPPGHQAIADGTESTDLLWASPGDLLDMASSQTRKIIFPTARNLELLALSENYDALVADCRCRPIEPVEPWIETLDGKKYLRIPDGLGYPVIREDFETAKRG